MIALFFWGDEEINGLDLMGKWVPIIEMEGIN